MLGSGDALQLLIIPSHRKRAMNSTDCITFILSSASRDDLSRIHDAARERRKTLDRIDAAAVEIGAFVRLDGLSPKALNGLDGEVVSISGSRCDVRLDKASTDSLRWSRAKRFSIPVDTEEYIVRGVPLSCARVKAGLF